MKKSKKEIKAVALKYNHGEDSVPQLLAKGTGNAARRIIEIAKECGVPVHEDSTLVEVLTALELNEDIPPELYRAVAEVLVFIYKLQTNI